MSKFEGPTAERIIQSDGHVSIGDDQQGQKTYTFLDRSLDRIYADLIRKNGKWAHEQLSVEYAALDRFYCTYVQANLNGSIGSVDFGGTYCEGGRRDFLAATESAVNARKKYRDAIQTIDHHENIVVQNVVCNDRSLEIAGYAIGKRSQRRAIVAAREILRNAGFKLGKLWGLVR